MDEKTAGRLKFIVNTCYFALIAVLAYLALKYVTGWILPFLVAFVIVSIVNPMIKWLKRKLRIEREIVSFFIMLLVYLLVAALLVLLVTQLVVGLRHLFSNAGEYYEASIRPTVELIGNSFSRFVDNLPPEWQERLLSLQGDILGTLKDWLLSFSNKGLEAISGLTAKVPVFLVALVFTIMLSFFISMQYTKVTSFIRSLLPEKADKFIADLRGVMKDTVARYLKATFTLMAITFVELAIGLLVLRTTNAIPIALGISVFDALPFFGTGAIMIPWVLIELLKANYSYALGLAILYGIVTLIRNIIEPKIVSDRLGINPIVTLVAIYFGFRTMNVLGMIFMPVAVQILLALHEKGKIVLFRRRDLETQTAPEETPPKEEDAKAE